MDESEDSYESYHTKI